MALIIGNGEVDGFTRSTAFRIKESPHRINQSYLNRENQRAFPTGILSIEAGSTSHELTYADRVVRQDRPHERRAATGIQRLIIRPGSDKGCDARCPIQVSSHHHRRTTGCVPMIGISPPPEKLPHSGIIISRGQSSHQRSETVAIEPIHLSPARLEQALDMMHQDFTLLMPLEQNTNKRPYNNEPNQQNCKQRQKSRILKTK